MGGVAFMWKALCAIALTTVLVFLYVSSTGGMARLAKKRRHARKVIIWVCGDDHVNIVNKILKEHDLQEGEYFVLSWAGGPNVAIHGLKGEKDFIQDQIEILVYDKGFNEAIVATHQHCAWLKKRGFTDPDQGKKDAPGIQAFLQKKAPGVRAIFPYYSYTNYETKTVCDKPEYIQVEQEAPDTEPQLVLE